MEGRVDFKHSESDSAEPVTVTSLGLRVRKVGVGVMGMWWYPD